MPSFSLTRPPPALVRIPNVLSVFQTLFYKAVLSYTFNAFLMDSCTLSMGWVETFSGDFGTCENVFASAERFSNARGQSLRLDDLFCWKCRCFHIFTLSYGFYCLFVLFEWAGTMHNSAVVPSKLSEAAQDDPSSTETGPLTDQGSMREWAPCSPTAGPMKSAAQLASLFSLMDPLMKFWKFT